MSAKSELLGGMRVRTIVQDRPVDDGDAHRQDQRNVVQHPVDFERVWHFVRVAYFL